MPIAVHCPSCRAPLLLADNVAEEAVACVICRHRFSRIRPVSPEVLEAIPARPSDTLLPSTPQPPAPWTPRDRAPRQPEHPPHRRLPANFRMKPRASWSPTTWLGLSALLLFGGGGCIILAYLDSNDRQRPVNTIQTIASAPRHDWHVLSAAISAEGDAWLRPGDGAISSLDFSPDGARLACTSGTAVTLWNLATASTERQWEDRSGIPSAVFHPDGSILALAGGKRDIKFWDVTTGAIVATLSTDLNRARAIAFNPRGDTLASANGREVVLWDVRTRRNRTSLAGHTWMVTSVAFSPDGNWLASGSEDQSVILWNLQTGKPQFNMKGHLSAVRSVAFSSDGKRLASTYDNGNVNVWNTDTGEVDTRLRADDKSVSSVVFLPNGTGIFAGSESGNIYIWELPSGNLQAALAAHTDAVTSLAISRDDRTLASGSRDTTIRLWRIRTRP